MSKSFGMPAFFVNNYVIPAMQVRYFRINPDLDTITVYIDNGELITSCKCDQLGFGFFPNEPPEEEKKEEDESCIIKPV